MARAAKKTADISSRMNCEVYRAVLSAHMKPDASIIIGQHFTEQMDNNQKQSAKATQDVFTAM